MDIKSERTNEILIFSINGRLDAYGASKLDEAIKETLKDDDLSVVFDLKEVPYLSSGGIRTFLKTEKWLNERGGKLHLTNIQLYPKEVLEMAGFDQIFSMHSTLETALDKPDKKTADFFEIIRENNLSFKIIESSKGDANIKIVGDIYKVLHASLGEEDIYSKRFSQTEYSIGLGGLGDEIKDYMSILGEMITIGGTMVWLPTDGHDTPDFLIPQKDTGKVTIHTGFNAALDGKFNDVIMVKGKNNRKFSVDELYQSIFLFARKMRSEFKGIISIAMQADIEEFYSSGVNISPIKNLAPYNGGMIIDKENINRWMNINNHPLYNGETMISFGLGVDLESDLSTFDGNMLNSLFYMHPANVTGKNMLLHNHAVVFKHITLNGTTDLDVKIREILSEGDFLDMRHLLDNTKLKRALVGISYISNVFYEY
jgi:anti-anti-sigma factor